MVNINEIKKGIEMLVEFRQIPKEKMWEAIEIAFATAYKKEYAKSDQIIKSKLNSETGDIQFFKVKIVLSEEDILPENEDAIDENDKRVRFNSERHIMIDDARMVTENVSSNEEILFPIETKTTFGRISFQSAKQILLQKLREQEREIILSEYKDKTGTIVSGIVQRVEKGNIYIDLGNTVAVMHISQQMRWDRFKPGDKIRAYITEINFEKKFGNFIKLSRTVPEFLIKLFELEVIELKEGLLSIKKIVRYPGVRSKLAVISNDDVLDPIGAFVGVRGVRVLTVKSELGGEQIDIVEYSPDTQEFIFNALSPAEVIDVSFDKENDRYIIKATDKQIPLLIGKRGQNFSLAAQLVDVNFLVVNMEDEEIAEVEKTGKFEILKLVENFDTQKSEGNLEQKEKNMKDGVEEKMGEQTEENVKETEEKIEQEGDKENLEENIK